MTHIADTRVRPHPDAPWDPESRDEGPTIREDLPTSDSPYRPKDHHTSVDPARLYRALEDVVRGEVRFDTAARGAYAHDASHYRQPPIGVVVPRDEDDVVAAVRVCREHGAPILARGGGTSLAGQCCNTAVVLDFTKYMNDVLEIDAERRLARVQPGCVLDDLRDEAALHDLTFGPDPATHNHCTLGGMIGNNSCGIHSVMAANYGPGPRTQHQVHSLKVLTYDGEILEVGPTSDDELDRIVAEGGRRGEIYEKLRDLRDRYADLVRERFPDIPRRVSGYNLPQLLPENGFNVAEALVGTECTCVVILEATVKLMWRPKGRALVVVGYEDVFHAGDHVVEIMEHRPIGLEGIDRGLISDMKHEHFHVDDLNYLPEGDGFLLVEFGGDDEAASYEQAKTLKQALEESDDPPREVRIYWDEEKEQKVWEVRESGLGATAWVPGEDPTWPGWEDAGVPPENVGDYLRDFQKLLEHYGYRADLYGHFGQGCIHCRINFDHRTAEGIQKYVRFITDAADLVVRYGGSLSGEHGDGQSRGTLLPRMYGEELVEAFREFKSIWDPDWRMNPGKVVDAWRPDQNLSLGTGYHPQPVETWFHYGNDVGGFVGATERCVGVGKCRRDDGGVMCPSYMVTREEIHSTRGRARLLFEMMRGDVVADGWKSDAVHEALDLCLACKGCRSDCPVDVDMATYKAEFLSHYYDGAFRFRPRTAYAMGWIYWWARLASKFAPLVNWATHAPGLARLIKWAGGIAQDRDVPRFASETLRDWFHRERRDATTSQDPPSPGALPAVGDERADVEGPDRVILWPDTFNNFFHPDVGRATVAVLERAGFRVVMPKTMLCCGRPLYDYGFMGQAKKLLRDILDELGPEIRAGTPIVGMEPSCVAVFRDEFTGLFPHDVDAERLSRQTYVLGEFIEKYHDRFDLPEIPRKALVHAHCHYQSACDWSKEASLLDRLGLDWSRPEQSCCGMAGSFGFEAGDKYEVSHAMAERHLAPAIRETGEDTLLLADGFSCREQVRQTTGRMPLHLAELLEREGTD